MGQLLSTLRSRTPVDPLLDSRLRRALKLRNWLAHDYFWERAGSILTRDGRERMITELQEVADFLNALDRELTAVSDRWLERAGISRDVIQAELEKYQRGEDA